MSETRGVFSLKELVDEILSDDWIDLNNVWVSPPILPPNTGYFGGGTSPSNVSTMDKTSFADDTTAAVPGAALSVARNSLAATGNSDAGYFGGGTIPVSVFYSTMDKLTYSDDTTAQVPGAALAGARRYLAATGNSDAGYFGGGKVSSDIVSTMDKLTYSSETTGAVPGAAQETQQQVTLVVVVVATTAQQWIRSLMHLILQQKFLVRH